MPLFDLEDPATGTIITVEHPQAPTQEEALAIFSTASQPQAVDPERQSVIQSFQKPTRQRLQDVGMIAPKAVGGIFDMLGGAAGEVVNTAENALNVANEGQGIMATEKALFGPLVQSGIEGVSRIGYDVANAARQAAPALADLITREIARNPISAVNPQGAIAGIIKDALTPKTPTEQQIDQELAKRQENQAFEQVRQEGVAPAIPFVEGGKLGEVLPNVAELSGILADPQLVPALVTAAGVSKFPSLVAKLPGSKANLISNALEAGGRASTGFKATARDFLTKFKNPTTETEIANIVKAADEGTLLKPVQEVAEVAGIPTSAKDFAPKVKIAKEARGAQLDEFLQGENGSTPLNAEAVKQAVIDDINAHPKLNDPELSLEEQASRKQALIDRAEVAFGKEWKARDLFEEQKRLNTLQKADIEKAKVSRENLLAGNPSKSMDDAARRAISKVLDDYQKGITGIDDNAFRAYGALSELESDVGSAYNRAVTQRSLRAAGKAPAVNPRSVVGGKIGAGVEVARPVVGKIAADELKDLDAATKKLFQRLPKGQTPATLDQTIRQSLLNQSKQQPPRIDDVRRKLLEAEGASPEELNAYLNEEAKLKAIAEAGKSQGLEAVSNDLENIIRQSQVATPTQLSDYLTSEANLTKAERIAKAKEFARKLEEDILKAIRANP